MKRLLAALLIRSVLTGARSHAETSPRRVALTKPAEHLQSRELKGSLHFHALRQSSAAESGLLSLPIVPPPAHVSGEELRPTAESEDTPQALPHPSPEVDAILPPHPVPSSLLPSPTPAPDPSDVSDAFENLPRIVGPEGTAVVCPGNSSSLPSESCVVTSLSETATSLIHSNAVIDASRKFIAAVPVDSSKGLAGSVAAEKVLQNLTIAAVAYKGVSNADDSRYDSLQSVYSCLYVQREDSRGSPSSMLFTARLAATYGNSKILAEEKAPGLEFLHSRPGQTPLDAYIVPLDKNGKVLNCGVSAIMSVIATESPFFESWWGWPSLACEVSVADTVESSNSFKCIGSRTGPEEELRGFSGAVDGRLETVEKALSQNGSNSEEVHNFTLLYTLRGATTVIDAGEANRYAPGARPLKTASAHVEAEVSRQRQASLSRQQAVLLILMPAIITLFLELSLLNDLVKNPCSLKDLTVCMATLAASFWTMFAIVTEYRKTGAEVTVARMVAEHRESLPFAYAPEFVLERLKMTALVSSMTFSRVVGVQVESTRARPVLILSGVIDGIDAAVALFGIFAWLAGSPWVARRHKSDIFASDDTSTSVSTIV